MNKIAAYVLRDGKAFAKEFRRKYDGKKLKNPIKTTIFNTEALKKLNEDIAKTAGIVSVTKAVDKYAHNADMLKTNEIVKELLGDDISEYSENFKNDLVTDGVVSSAHVDAFLDIVENGKKTIASVKSLANRVDKDFKDAISYIRSLAKAKSKDDENYKIKNATAACSAFEKLISMFSKLAVTGAKTMVKQARVNLSEILSEAVQESAVLAEAAALDAEAEVDDAMSPEVSAEIEEDPELKDAVEDVVDSPEVDDLAECLH